MIIMIIMIYKLLPATDNKYTTLQITTTSSRVNQRKVINHFRSLNINYKKGMPNLEVL